MKGANRLFWERNAMVIVGMLLFSMGINFFIVPAQLYNGGVLGISQIIRTILTTYLSLSFGGTDIAGIINLILNIPLFVLAYCSIGRNFCVINQFTIAHS